MQVGSVMSVAVLAAAVVVGGNVTATASSPRPRPTPAGATVQARAASEAPSGPENSFVPITPCRIVDTRKAMDGIVSARSPRTFVAGGDVSLAIQGGSASGCDVAVAATAVQANVVAVGAASSGYLTVYPGGTAAPLASWLNFRDGKAIANGGVITLDRDGGTTFAVKASRSTHVVVDVTGYYVPPLWAQVAFGPASIVAGSRASGVRLQATGQAVVTFDRDVSLCTPTVTPVDRGDQVDATFNIGDPTDVVVDMADAGGNPANVNFRLVVTC
ncbi:MAG: hypothetical protein ACJ71T_05330 [Actinomycetales bacterium]